MGKRFIARRVPGGAKSELERWAEALIDIGLIDVRRTSNRSRKDFDAMLKRGTSGRPDDPDVQQLAEYGHSIVLPEGEALRRRLGAFTITRGSVDGSGSRAVLGWAIPIGRTLFMLYLESARKFDIPGPTPDQGMNAFAEALRAVIRGTRPREVHTPLLSRVFRLIDHAVAVMRTLRTYRVKLYAEGRHIALDTDDDKFMATVQATMSDKDAAATVARLEGDRLAIYGRGEWYLGRELLPFTWDTQHEFVEDPLTGARIRRDVDKHVTVPTAKGPELLQLLVRLGGTPGVARDQIAVALGRKGVLSRAPKHTGQFLSIDRLRRPRTAVDSLITPEWVAAFKAGWYEKEVEFTSDLRSSYPNAPLRVDEDGRRWLKIRVRMPAPDGGWGITDQEWAAFEAEQFDRAGQKSRGGRSAATKGRLRPLLGLCLYVQEDVQRVVLGFESAGYQLCERPFALMSHPDASPRAWGPESCWIATVNSGAWHTSLANALIDLGVALADRLAPLERQELVSVVDSRRARLDREVTEAETAATRISNRIAGIRQERQEMRGDAELSDAERQTEIDRLKREEKEARTQLKAAEALVRECQQRLAQDADEPAADAAATVQEDADFSTLELVIAALLRYRATAPAALAQVVQSLLGDSLRWELIHHGTQVAWSAEVRLPLRDGTLASRRVHGTVSTSTGSSRAHLAKPDSERQKRLPQRARTAAGSSADAYAKRLFLDGASLTQIASDRGITAHGGSAGTVYRELRSWLLLHGVASQDLARAALDLPILAARRALYRALTDDGSTPLDQFEAFIGDIYRNGIPHLEDADGAPRRTSWGVLWCAAPMLAERRVYDVLKNQPVPGAFMSAAGVADLADLPYSTSGTNRAVGRGISLLDMTNGGRRRRAAGDISAALPIFLDKDWTVRDRRPAEQKHVALRGCAHRGCRGHLLPVPVPEIPGMLLCDTCRRLPGHDAVVFPRDYLLHWSGGRRRRVGNGAQVGTVLIADRDRPGATEAAA